MFQHFYAFLYCFSPLDAASMQPEDGIALGSGAGVFSSRNNVLQRAWHAKLLRQFRSSSAPAGAAMSRTVGAWRAKPAHAAQERNGPRLW